ncbi:uncharacterized protein KD926_002732 [Aspergillus affinis]|uniref:uncharacterized protein n=1 Tax=Aspergillus affinis TaxID=1070780 RepID=UPI0022FDB895|nr:uncharacterized protein KD926_002732 [Aspergillus affinis]KAI9043841.1 hypothetical protein KD926_002732 [Aspergillus affinis]
MWSSVEIELVEPPDRAGAEKAATHGNYIPGKSLSVMRQEIYNRSWRMISASPRDWIVHSLDIICTRHDETIDVSPSTRIPMDNGRVTLYKWAIDPMHLEKVNDPHRTVTFVLTHDGCRCRNCYGYDAPTLHPQTAPQTGLPSPRAGSMRRVATASSPVNIAARRIFHAGLAPNGAPRPLRLRKEHSQKRAVAGKAAAEPSEGTPGTISTSAPGPQLGVSDAAAGAKTSDARDSGSIRRAGRDW